MLSSSLPPQPARVGARREGGGGGGGLAAPPRGNLVPWSPAYTCARETVLHEEFNIRSARMLRRVLVGERLECLEGPREDAAHGVLRMFAVAAKDAANGWRSEEHTSELQSQ